MKLLPHEQILFFKSRSHAGRTLLTKKVYMKSLKVISLCKNGMKRKYLSVPIHFEFACKIHYVYLYFSIIFPNNVLLNLTGWKNLEIIREMELGMEKQARAKLQRNSYTESQLFIFPLAQCTVNSQVSDKTAQTVIFCC